MYGWQNFEINPKDARKKTPQGIRDVRAHESKRENFDLQSRPPYLANQQKYQQKKKKSQIIRLQKDATLYVSGNKIQLIKT